jgi:hypothetical protein
MNEHNYCHLCLCKACSKYERDLKEKIKSENATHDIKSQPVVDKSIDNL